MTHCDDHGKLSNKLSWILGVLSVGSLVIMLLITICLGVQSYTIDRVDETLRVTNENSVSIANIEGQLANISGCSAPTAGAVVAYNTEDL